MHGGGNRNFLPNRPENRRNSILVALKATHKQPNRPENNSKAPHLPRKQKPLTSMMRVGILDADLEFAVADLLVVVEAVVTGYG